MKGPALQRIIDLQHRDHQLVLGQGTTQRYHGTEHEVTSISVHAMLHILGPSKCGIDTLTACLLQDRGKSVA